MLDHPGCSTRHRADPWSRYTQSPLSAAPGASHPWVNTYPWTLWAGSVAESPRESSFSMAVPNSQALHGPWFGHRLSGSCNTQQEIPVVLSPSASTCGLLPGYIFMLFPIQHDLRLWGKQLQRGRKTKPNPKLSKTAAASQLNFILTNPKLL